MKALVLCGGLPQIELINNLKSRGIHTILADYNPQVAGRAYADEFFPVSVFDIEAVKNLAAEQQVDFIITACADQVLEVSALISAELGLPCYIGPGTANDVSNKMRMKQIFSDNGVPTSRFIFADAFDANAISGLKFPLVVKPVDSYSSKGVTKVETIEEAREAFDKAIGFSRAKTAIIEEFVSGTEMTVDFYIEAGKAKYLCSSRLDKLSQGTGFVIFRSFFPAGVSEIAQQKILAAGQGIADGFRLVDAPMFMQLIVNGDDVSVIEFCARSGGGPKYKTIKELTGFDVVDAVVELTLGAKPHFEEPQTDTKALLNEFLYCREGVMDHIEGLDELKSEGIIYDYVQYRPDGSEIGQLHGSGDRVAYLTMRADDLDHMREKYAQLAGRIKVLDPAGNDILINDFKMF